MAELRNGEIILLGRERDDCKYLQNLWLECLFGKLTVILLLLDIAFANSRISALKVERHLMGLPYIAEACAVAVPVDENKQLCGAVVRLKDGTKTTLTRIRADLQADLDATMLPTVLRHLPPHEELPRTATGKPIKRQVIEDFFYDGDCGRDFFSVANPPPGVEFYGMPIEA